MTQEASRARAYRRRLARAKAALRADPAWQAQCRAQQRKLRRRKLRFPWFWTPGEVEMATELYCKLKGRELGGRPPRHRRCTKRLPPGIGRQCWLWRVLGSDRCWRHQRVQAAGSHQFALPAG